MSPAQAASTKKRRRAPSASASNSRRKKSTAASTSDLPTAKRKQAVAPPPPPPPVPPPPSSILIIDNGGDTIKYGWSTDSKPRVLPNVTARLLHQITVLVGDELERFQNPNSIIDRTRSTERGVINNLGNQTQVWKRMLDLLGVAIPPNSEAAKSFGWKATSTKKKTTITTTTTTMSSGGGGGTLLPPKTIPAHTIAVVLLLPPHCPRLLLDQLLYLWLEDFGVSRVGFGVSTVCAAKEHPKWHSSCTIDLGWSSSLVVPTFRKQPIHGSAIRRLPIGGRHMINILKYYMSYRQYNLMDQEPILRDIFEKLAYCSLDFRNDMKVARYTPSGRRSYDRDYVLPDYQTSHQGQVRLPYALQKFMEQEAKRASGDGADDDIDDEEDDDEEDDDEEDEDFVAADENGANNNSNGDGVDDNDKADGGIDENDDDGGENGDDDEEETEEEARKRILKQRAEEERRRREQEEDEQILRVSVERFTVPEVLFRPKDAGLQQDLVGLAEAIVQAVGACPKAYHPALYRSLYITGGLSRLPNLKVRLEEELRTLVPSEYKVGEIQVAEAPLEEAWLGAKASFDKTKYPQWSIGREEWIAAGKRKAYTKLLLSSGGSYV